MLTKIHKLHDYEKIPNYNVPKAEIYFSTFYLGDLSKTIVKELKQIVGQSYPQVQLLFINKSHSTIGSHFSFKDKQPQMLKSNLIYRYTCECCKAFYIGQTSKQFAVRIGEHRGVSARTGKPFASKNTSDIFKHCQTKCKTHVNPDNFTIEDSLQSGYGLLTLESLHQKTKIPQIGIHQKSTPIMSFD